MIGLGRCSGLTPFKFLHSVQRRRLQVKRLQAPFQRKLATP